MGLMQHIWRKTLVFAAVGSVLAVNIGCDGVAGGVLGTIALAFDIVSIWL